LNWLIPRNLRKRRLLRHSDLYRGFESTPLRHAVWTAEKLRCTLPRKARNTPIFRDTCPTKWTGENALPAAKAVTVLAFLWRAHSQSGFKEGVRIVNNSAMARMGIRVFSQE
jgi:hypothetical protein